MPLTTRATLPTRLATALTVLATMGAAPACGGSGDGSRGSPTAPTVPTPPPAGTNFSVLPLPIETIARITSLGYNNTVIPNDHTYWLTCDVDWILQGTRPCHRERQPLRAPADGVVRDAGPGADGFLRVEGPPGLVWTFGHVTAEPGVVTGGRVSAGQVVARMFADHGFDFGLSNAGVHHPYVTPARYPDQYLHGQHPAEQFPESLRSELASRSNSRSEPFGTLDFDVPGTAAGAWFLAGTPHELSLRYDGEPRQLWFGRWAERRETKAVGLGDRPDGFPGKVVAADDATPDWESITPATGVVAIRLWNVSRDARPNLSWPTGTMLVELQTPTRLRMEWFPTHAPVSAFTPAARTYER